MGYTSETGFSFRGSLLRVSAATPLPRCDLFETSTTEVVSCFGEPAPPVRFRAPLAAFPIEVRCSWAFHDPASSAHGFSQPFDGLLLQPASSSYFIRAPPLGFQSSKSNERCSMPEPFSPFRKGLSRKTIPVWKAKTLDTQAAEAYCYGNIDSIATHVFLRLI